MQYTGSMQYDSIPTNPSSITQPCSALFKRWKTPLSCLAQQYQKIMDHFESHLKAIVFASPSHFIPYLQISGLVPDFLTVRLHHCILRIGKQTLLLRGPPPATSLLLRSEL